MNRVTLCGRLTKDCELRTTTTGTAVCTFTVAVDRPRSRDGVKEADFIRCKCFGKQGETIAFYKGKGDMIAVDGRLQTGSYEKDGIRHYTTDVIVERADFLAKEKHAQSDDKQASRVPTAYGGQMPQGFENVEDDDVPW